MKRIIIMTAFILLIAGLLSLYSYQNKTTIQSPNISPNDYDVVKNELFEKLEKDNPRVAIETLKAKMSEDALILQSCHELLHELGRESYKKYNNFGQAIKYQDDICVSGYTHGVIQEYFKEAKNLDASMFSVCQNYPKGSYLLWQCYHGIGHGLMYYTDNDLPTSLKKCATYKDYFAQSSCSNGAYMENFNADENLHTSKYLDPKDPFFPCRSSVFRDDCFTNAPVYALSIEKYNYQEVIDRCNQFKGHDALSCIVGVGVQMTRRNMNDFRFINKFCLSQRNEQIDACYRGVVSWYVGFYGSLEEATNVCSQIDSRYQASCEKEVKTYESLF